MYELVGERALEVVGRACEQDAPLALGPQALRVAGRVARGAVERGLLLDPDLQVVELTVGQDGEHFGAQALEDLGERAGLFRGVPADGAGVGLEGLRGRNRHARRGDER